MTTLAACRTKTLVLLASALCLGLVMGCRKGGKKSAPSAGAPASPGALAKAIGGAYQQAMADLAKLVRSHPAPAAVTPRVKALKEKVVQEMVKYGRQREALRPAQRRRVDSGVRDEIRAVNRADFAAMSKAAMHYRSKDNSLANLISGFNVITQYASFELLRKQQPREAQRLGIK